MEVVFLQKNSSKMATNGRGTIHKGCLQNFWVFLTPPCPKFGLIHRTNFKQPPLLCLLLDPPLCGSPLCMVPDGGEGKKHGLIVGNFHLHAIFYKGHSTASLSHLRTKLPESSSRPLPTQQPNHAT